MSAVQDATSVYEITTEDYLDSRDLIELQETVQAWLDDEDRDPDDFDEDDARAIIAAIQEFENSGVREWHAGETFIRGSYFEEYAEQMAEDIGAISRDAQWPLDHIDWTAAADALKIDYMSVEVNGVEYWCRA